VDLDASGSGMAAIDIYSNGIDVAAYGKQQTINLLQTITSYLATTILQ
jgi:hypothetical protein